MIDVYQRKVVRVSGTCTEEALQTTLCAVLNYDICGYFANNLNDEVWKEK